jgi:hypothetical protein
LAGGKQGSHHAFQAIERFYDILVAVLPAVRQSGKAGERLKLIYTWQADDEGHPVEAESKSTPGFPFGGRSV